MTTMRLRELNQRTEIQRLLREHQELTHANIAELLGCHPYTVGRVARTMREQRIRTSWGALEGADWAGIVRVSSQISNEASSEAGSIVYDFQPGK